MQDEKKVTRRAHKGTNGKQVQVNIPIPEVGQTLTLEIERYNLTILVERGAEETQEQKRLKYTPVSPVAPDRRLHAARLGVGALKAKRMQVTLCSEDATVDRAVKSGARVDLPLDTVSCVGCLRVLRSEGVEIKNEGAGE